MKDFKNLTLTQTLLLEFKGAIEDSKAGWGAISYEIFDSYLDENPEYVTFYIDLFNLAKDDFEKDILAIIIIGIYRHPAVEQYLRNRDHIPWSDKDFNEIDRIGDWKLTKEDFTRLMSLPKDHRLSYNSDDEAVVKEIIDDYQKNIEERERLKTAKEEGLKKNRN